MTKVVTIVAAMMLVEECKMSLRDPASAQACRSRAPGYREAPAHPYRRLTYAREDHPVAVRYSRRKIFENPSLRDFIVKVASLPLVAHPGEKYNYGIHTDVLGYLVQVVSGMPFDQFVHTRILAPLKMNDTFFEPSPAKAARVAKTYSVKDGKLVENPPDDLA
jgi:CubicO group peptidase (beta-lactamase class C family)